MLLKRNMLLLPMVLQPCCHRECGSETQLTLPPQHALWSVRYDQTGASMLQGGFLQFLPQDEAGGADPAAEEVVQIIAQVSEQATAGLWYELAAYCVSFHTVAVACALGLTISTAPDRFAFRLYQRRPASRCTDVQDTQRWTQIAGSHAWGPRGVHKPQQRRPQLTLPAIS